MFLFLTAVNCGTLSNPVSGRVSHTAGTTFGQTATYSCNTGYKLVGSSTRTCQATRLWSGNAPTCQGNYSVTLTSVEVPGRNQTLFCCVFRPRYHIQNAVVQNIH